MIVYYLTNIMGDTVFGTWHRSLREVARIQQKLERAAEKQGGYSRSVVFKDEKRAWKHGQYVSERVLRNCCLDDDEYATLRKIEGY